MKTGDSTRVPDEILLRILTEAKLNPQQLVKMAEVSKQFDRVSSTNDLWRDATPESFQRDYVRSHEASGTRGNGDEFKGAFMERMKGRNVGEKWAYRRLLEPRPKFLEDENDLSQSFGPNRYWAFTDHNPNKIAAQKDYQLVKQYIMQHEDSFNGTFVEEILLAGAADFLNEPAIAMAILRRSPSFLPLFNDTIKDSQPHIVAVLGAGLTALEHASARLRDKTDVVDYAVRKGPLNYTFASEAQRSRKSLFEFIFSPRNSGYHNLIGPYRFSNVPEVLLRDPERSIVALRSGMPFVLVPSPARSLPEVIAAKIRRDGFYKSNAREVAEAITEPRSNDRQFMHNLISKEYLAVRYLGNQLEQDVTFMRTIAYPAFLYGAVRPGDPISRDYEAVRSVITSSSGSGNMIRVADRSLRANSVLQKLAFDHGATVKSLELDGTDRLKAWFVYKTMRPR